MDDWLVVFGSPFNKKIAYRKYLEAANFDEAVNEGRKQWAALVAEVESTTQKFVPNVDLLLVAYDPEHKIGRK